MSTTSLFVELIVVGVGAAIWLTLLTLALFGYGWVQVPADKALSIPAAIPILAVVYVLGIVCHTPKSCGTGGATTWTVSPAAGNTYYLVTPVDGTVEGSYGRTGGNVERLQGTTSCLPQAVGACQ